MRAILRETYCIAYAGIRITKKRRHDVKAVSNIASWLANVAKGIYVCYGRNVGVCG